MKSLFTLIPLFYCLILLINTSCTAAHSCCCEPEEEYFCMYTHEMWTGANMNDVLSAKESIANGFGQIRSDDWLLLDGNGSNANVIGRVQGQHTLYNNNNWNVAFTVVFQADRFNGSTLQVRGYWVPEKSVEWSILGGTGQFTLAQGIIYGRTLLFNLNERRMQLCFQVFYHPIARPTESGLDRKAHII